MVGYRRPIRLRAFRVARRDAEIDQKALNKLVKTLTMVQNKCIYIKEYLMMNEDENLNIYRGSTQGTIIKLSDFKKEFAKYMQTDNLAFLFGAGCSSFYKEKNQVGIPTMAGLYDEFTMKYPDFKIGNKSINDKDFEQNLERVMDILISLRESQNYYTNNEVEDPNNQIRIIREFIKEKINNQTHSPNVIKLYKNFYMRTVRKSRKNPINIATTNYDLFNELALDELGFFYNDGFSGTFHRKFNPLVYNYIYANNLNLNKNIWSRVDNFYNLFKIHGSISWEKQNGSIVEKDPTNINSENVMIYPTPLKDRSTLMVPYSDLFRMFQNQLVKPNTVLITLGYSFGDDHINRIILNNLANPTFRLIVFGDTASGNKVNNIYHLLETQDPRIVVVNSLEKIHFFDNFVNKILPEPLIDVDESVKLTTAIQNIDKKLNGGVNYEQ